MNDINPIKPVIRMPVFNQGLIVFLLLALIIFLLFIFIFLYLKKKRRKKEAKIDEKIEEIQVDYREIALNRWKALEEYLDKDEFKIFYLKISEIIKEYLSQIYKSNYIDLTSLEILKQKQISREIKKNLENFFKISDLEKFSGLEQDSKNAKKVYNIAKQIIQARE